MAGKAKRVRVAPGLYRRGPSWEACATSPGQRKPEWKILGSIDDLTQRDAEDLRDQFKVDVRKGTYKAPSKDTLVQVAKDWLKTQEHLRDIGELAPNSYLLYAVAVNKHIAEFKELKAAAVTGDDLVKWHRDLSAKKKLSASSVKSYWSTLRQVMNYAVRRKLIPANPINTLERRERPKGGASRQRVYSREEIALLLTTTSGPIRLMLAVGIFAGLRLSEVLALTWGDIDREAGLIRVRYQLDDEGKRVRLKSKQDGQGKDVVLMGELASTLRRARLASAWSQETDPVISEHGGPLPRGSASKRANKAIKAAKVPDATFHDTRRTFVSILISQGRDVAFVAGQIGDTIQTTLGTYGHMWDNERHMDETRQQLDAEFGHLLKADHA